MTLPVLFFLASIIGSGSRYPSVKRPEPAPGSTRNYVVHTSDPDISRAGQLLNRSQPLQALELLKSALKSYPQDADVLLLAGLAAYRSDRLAAAIAYWQQSLELSPNEDLNKIYADAKREAQVDHGSNRIESAHITLRYDPADVSPDTARSVLTALEEDYSRISAELGCSTTEPIIAILQDRAQYRRASGAAVWSGGHYDGRIHLALTSEVAVTNASQAGKSGIGPRIQRALAHEMTHACLSNIPSGSNPWPIWFEEGLAQRLSGDTLDSLASAELETLISERKLPPLEHLGSEWFCLSERDALAAYRLSLAAVDELYRLRTESGIPMILADPDSLPKLTQELDARLGL